ncbi:MAG: hypothetical protein GEU97_22540 [Actinophytocola sp.]|nr:hypothetical protein [Actinophytocola sp.]
MNGCHSEFDAASGRHHGPDDGGFATVWTAGAVLALLSVFAMVMYVGAATHARHRAAAAADLAALGAAARLSHGTEHACETAVLVTRRMVADLHSCQVRGWDVLVTVEVAARLPLSGLAGAGAATARARAGPAEARAGPVAAVR